MASRGRSARNKGASFERKLANLFRDTYGYPEAKRGMVFEGQPDVILEGIHVEAKAQETLHPYDWIEQAVAEHNRKDPDNTPVVFFKKNNKPILCLMRFEDFMDMYGELRHGREKNDKEELR